MARTAAQLGVEHAYVNRTGTFYAFPYVAPVGTTCIALIGFNEEYSELALDKIPDIQIRVFARYGPTKDKDAVIYDGGDLATIKVALKNQTDKCAKGS